MDDLTIHIDEILLGGSTAGEEDAIAAAILGQASESLSPQLLSDISRAVAASVQMDLPGDGR